MSATMRPQVEVLTPAQRAIREALFIKREVRLFAGLKGRTVYGLQGHALIEIWDDYGTWSVRNGVTYLHDMDGDEGRVLKGYGSPIAAAVVYLDLQSGRRRRA